MNIFVGNLTVSVKEIDVRRLFEAFGTVSSISLKQKVGKNARTFGFIVMPDEIEAKAAIVGLDEKDYLGRPLNVTEERLKPVKPKKDYKEIKRLKLEAKTIKETPVDDDVPTIPEKDIKSKAFKKLETKDRPSKKSQEAAKKFAEPTGSQAWERRKGRGTAKPWKKKPGGVNKKFKYSR